MALLAAVVGTDAVSSEVGRTGTLKAGPVVVDVDVGVNVDVDVDVDVGPGHVAGPQLRSVAQQPPPRLGAQDR